MPRGGTRIYVGNLPTDIKDREIDDIFHKYGRIRDVDIKTPQDDRAPAFAFVEFDDDRDAEDAVRGRDNYKFDGARLRVEHARGGGGAGGFRGGRGGGPPMRGGRGGARGGRGGGPGSRGGPPERGNYRVAVEGLPERTSWQDLKDHFRQAGYVCYTSTSDEDGTGVVEFKEKEDYEYALDKMDKTECKNRFGSTSEIRVFPEKGSGGGGGGGKDRSRSRSRSRSPSRSRSRSPADKKEKSRSRSRDEGGDERGDERAPAGNGEERERSPSR